jgi:hypothetical protein
MSFGIYIVGFIIFIAGVAIGAHMLDVPPQWMRSLHDRGRYRLWRDGDPAERPSVLGTPFFAPGSAAGCAPTDFSLRILFAARLFGVAVGG